MSLVSTTASSSVSGSVSDHQRFFQLVKARTGIELTESKLYLLQSRLLPIAATEGLDSVEALLASFRLKPDPRVLDSAIDAMTTNETLFFRDQTPFDHLKAELIRLAALKRPEPIRIWSAACSTGQEPYSIAMLVAEEAPNLMGARVEIVGSDVSDRCLAKARSGLYSQFEVQRGLTIQRLVRHFGQQDGAWAVKPELKQSIIWKSVNLMSDFRNIGRFDIVFCRNVLIYFDRATKRDVLTRIGAQVRDGGLLLLGAAETTLGLCECFRSEPQAHGAHVKVSVADAAAPAPRLTASGARP